MRILIITQWFDPEPNNMKALVFAKKLQDLGNDVEVITGFPNYPIGKIYEGYKLKLHKKQIMDGVTVHRVYLYPSHDRNKWKRMANYFSFGWSAKFFSRFFLKGKFDIVYVYHPPVTSTTAAFSIARRKKAKVVLDVNDLWPDSIASTGMMSNKKLLGIIDKWCKKTYKKAAAINVLSKGIKVLLEERGVPDYKISTIPVWCNEALLTESRHEEFYQANRCHEKFTVLYAGAMGEAQGLNVLIDVAERLKETAGLQILLVGTGTCAEGLKATIEEKGLENIAVLPSVPSEQVCSVLNCADVLFVHLKKDELFSVTVPSKIPLYMASKKPIIAGLEGDAAKIIEDSKGGIVCESGNVDELVSAFLKVYGMTVQERKEMAERGYQYYQEHLSFESGVRAFNDLFGEVVRKEQERKEKKKRKSVDKKRKRGQR